MTGTLIPEAALRCGDRIAVHNPRRGTIAAVVVSISREPRRGDDVQWEAADRSCSGLLHCRPTDLVDRLSANGMVA